MGRSRPFEPLPRSDPVCDSDCWRSCSCRVSIPAPRRNARGFGLRDRGVLQLDLVAQIVECGLCTGDGGLSLRDLCPVVGRIDLHQQIAGLTRWSPSPRP
jgi:hypothetical protein